MGIAKALFALEATNGGHRASSTTISSREHTHGFEEFAAAVRECPMAEDRAALGPDARRARGRGHVYAHAKSVMFIYGMGLTQHEKGVETVQTMVNLALMRGNIGRPGAGICPVRGHSNVQGQRTVGITEKPDKVPSDKLKQQFGFDVPEKKGVNTVEACEGIVKGSVRAMVHARRQSGARGAGPQRGAAGLAASCGSPSRS